jgi:hypothetical protein
MSATPVDGLALGLLRRHVGGGAENHAHARRGHAQRRRVRRIRAGSLALERLREAEVKHLHGAVGAHLDVGRLEVAVNNGALVCGFERREDLHRDRQRLVHREA